MEAAWEAGTGELIGTLTLVYDHHVHELGEALTDQQHPHHAAILSTLHIHLDAHLCLEVLVLRGSAERIKAISDTLVGMRGVHARQAHRHEHGAHLGGPRCAAPP